MPGLGQHERASAPGERFRHAAPGYGVSMRITTVALAVSDLTVAADFFERTLELPVERMPQDARVQLGSTTLVLRGAASDEFGAFGSHGPAGTRAHHLAITVPSNKFAAAKEWVAARVELLHSEGADEFECSPFWDARSVYFGGPDGMVLELIVRRELDNATSGPFTSSDLLCVSEVGIAVPNVLATAGALASEHGITPYGGDGPQFAPVGDVNGLLILVSPGRPWFPTTTRIADVADIEVTVADDRGGPPLVLRSAPLRGLAGSELAG